MHRLPSAIAPILCLFASVAAFAQTDSASTSPTKIYASAGDRYTFNVAYESTGSESTDLRIDYTEHTANPEISPYGRCIEGSTIPPYDGAVPLTKYVWWESETGAFPDAAKCGGRKAITLTTFSGTVRSFPQGGAFVVVVGNNLVHGAANSTANDVTICRRTTIAGVEAAADPADPAAQSLTVRFADKVPAGCGGFAIPVKLASSANPARALKVASDRCNVVQDNAASCIVTLKVGNACRGKLQTTVENVAGRTGPEPVTNGLGVRCSVN